MSCRVWDNFFKVEGENDENINVQLVVEHQFFAHVESMDNSNEFVYFGSCREK